MSSMTKEYLVAGLATAGVIGTSYLAYTLYKRQHKPERVIVIPDQWTYAGKLSNVYMYPVKSCGPVVVDRSECSVLGLRNSWLRDRVLMVVDEKNNFITARAYPELLKVHPYVQGSVLTLRYEDREPCQVNLAEVAAIGKAITATVWGVKIEVRECGFDSSEFFSSIVDPTLQHKYRLVYYTFSHSRPGRPGSDTDARYVKFTKDDNGAAPDEVPFNLINEASVEDLNSRIKRSGTAAGRVTHRNFRPNFVLNGAEPFAEDNWSFVKIGRNVFEIVKPCTRCVLTTLDPETGIRDPDNEPLKTLKSYRQATDEATRRAMGSSPRMGLQMALRSPPGEEVAIGDDVYVA